MLGFSLGRGLGGSLGGGGTAPSYPKFQSIAGLLPEYDEDSTIADSYSGGLNLINLIPGKAGFDMVLSSDGTDAYLPELVGEIGSQDAYFLMKGTSSLGEGLSYFRTEAEGADLPEFAQHLHQTNEEAIYMSWACNYGDTHTTAWFSTTGASNTTAGAFMDISVSTNFPAKVVSEEEGGVSLWNTGTRTLVASPYNGDHVVINGLVKTATTIQSKWWVDGVLKNTVTVAIAKQDKTNPPSGAFKIARDNDTQKNNPVDGSKHRAHAGGYVSVEGGLTNEMAEAITDIYRTRHNLPYAP